MTVEIRGILRQLQMVSIVSMGFFMNGAMNGWITPALKKLESGNDYVTITSEQGSWLALYPEFGHFLAPVPVGIVADIVGRKPVYILNGILSLLGWITIAFANDVNFLFIGRIILGFTFGMHATLGHIYLSEICSKNLRGRFSSMAFVFNNVGILFQFIIGGCYSIRISSMIALMASLAYAILTFFIVESPYYLLTRGRDDEAKRIFLWFHATGYDRVSGEFASMVKSVRTHQNFRQAIGNLLSKNNSKGFVLVVIISFLSDMTGRSAVLTYAKENFVSEGLMSANNFMILLGIFIVGFSVAPALLSDKFGRKLTVIVTGIIIIISHVITGGIYYLHDKYTIEIPYYGWLLFITITTYLCSSFIGTSNVLTLRGELISENSRGLASGFASMSFAAAILIVIKMFQTIRDRLGIYYAFWVLAVISTIFTVFTLIFVPETKNKTLQEIQKDMQTTNDSKDESEERISIGATTQPKTNYL